MRATWRSAISFAWAAIVGLAASVANGAECGADALGTSRVLEIDAKTTPRVGKPFAPMPSLSAHEVVLTFDDGPRSTTTAHVLDALARQCVKATFFVIGENGVARPDLLRRERADGHSIGYHTWSHPLLDRVPLGVGEAEIDHGIDAVERVVYGEAHPPPTRFFRFPGLAAPAALLERLTTRGIVTFGADLWASDWRPMTPDAELKLVLQRLDGAGRGIVLFHDTKAQTAAMLPQFLEALRKQNYRIVAVAPAPGP